MVSGMNDHHNMPKGLDDGEGAGVLLFDGVCHLCNSAVRFVMQKDPAGRVLFASLQSEAGQKLLTEAGCDPRSVRSVVWLEQGRVYTKSTAVLRICRKLGGAWPLLYIFVIVPRPLRDRLYDVIARNRYRWFGRSETCMLPSPQQRERFLDL